MLPLLFALLTAAEAAPPRLVVLLVVDQYAAHLHDLARPFYTGGLARLSGDDARTATGRYAHACTWTAPGHATIGTGANPREHGIGPNYWLEGGKEVAAGAPGQLRVPTIGDAAVDAGRTVVSLSLKRRGATLVAGDRATVTAWPARVNDVWTWGRPEGAAPAPWLPGTAAIEQRFTGTWTPLPTTPARPDASVWEGSNPPFTATFEHKLTPALKERALYGTPNAGALLIDAARAALADEALALGRDTKADLLNISFSHLDYLGHAHTPESWETLDLLLRLDADLNALFADLDRHVGAGRYTVLLTADHGVLPTPAAMISERQLAEQLTAALRTAGLPGKARIFESAVWFTDHDTTRRQAYLDVVMPLLRADPRLAVVADVQAPVPPGTVHADAVAACLVADRSGEIALWPRWGVYWSWEDADGHDHTTGTGHGSPWPYDTDVPVLAWGADVKAGVGRLGDQRQIAPTLARLLRVAAPSGAVLPPLPLR